MAGDPAADAGACIALLVAVSLAGCMGPPAQPAGCETFTDLRDGAGDLRAACVGESVSLEGFFLANATASTARFIGGSSVSSTVIEEELPQTTNWTVGLFLNASFLADIEDPEGIVRDHGALVALPNFTVRHNLTYLQLDGRVRDVDQVLENRSQVNATFPLVIAETYDRLSPEHHTLQELAREFEAIVGTEPVRHIRTRGFGFGTTPAHLQAAQGNGDSDALLDVGIYELSDATYQAAPDDVQTYRIPMVRLTVGQGTELLGDRVRVHGFLVNTETLQGEAQTRADDLPRLADDRPTLRSRMEEAHQRAGGDLPVPILDNLVDWVGQARVDHHRIPAVFVAYRITPLPPEMDAPLQDLDPQPVPEDDLMVHLDTEGYAGGTTLETVCQAAQPGCDLPYDVGIYELVNFTVADDDHLTPHVYEVPVVYPVKDRAPNYLAAPVDVEGVWVTEDVARNAMRAFLADSSEGPGWGELLANPSARGQLSSWLTSVEGFIYAYEVNRQPPLHQAPTPVLLWSSNTTGDTITLRWTRTVADDFDRYEVHRSDRPVPRCRARDIVATISDRKMTQHGVGGEDTSGFVKVCVRDRAGSVARSNPWNLTWSPTERVEHTADIILDRLELAIADVTSDVARVRYTLYVENQGESNGTAGPYPVEYSAAGELLVEWETGNATVEAGGSAQLTGTVDIPHDRFTQGWLPVHLDAGERSEARIVVGNQTATSEVRTDLAGQLDRIIDEAHNDPEEVSCPHWHPAFQGDRWHEEHMPCVDGDAHAWSVSADTVTLEATLDVHNPDDDTYTARDWELGAVLGGTEVGSAQVDGEVSIPPGETREVAIDVGPDPSALQDWWVGHVDRCEESSVGLEIGFSALGEEWSWSFDRGTMLRTGLVCRIAWSF